MASVYGKSGIEVLSKTVPERVSKVGTLLQFKYSQSSQKLLFEKHIYLNIGLFSITNLPFNKLL